MKVTIQTCYSGSDRYYFRALICGGLLIRCDAGDSWNRKYASAMLDLIETETGLERSAIRFHHV